MNATEHMITAAAGDLSIIETDSGHTEAHAGYIPGVVHENHVPPVLPASPGHYHGPRPSEEDL